MRLALSLLCEHPKRKTSLTSLFHELVQRSIQLYPDLEWVIFIGKKQEWNVIDDRVKVIRNFPANNRLYRRIFADLFRVSLSAKKHKSQALITIGFCPFFKCLPVAMHVLSLQHLTLVNRVGRLRSFYRQWMIKRGLKKADLVITNTQFAVKQILGVFPSAETKLIQSYEGLQHELFHPKARNSEWAELQETFNLKPNYLFWSSNFYSYKQAEALFEAYARLPENLREKHSLVMIGGGWNGMESAKKRAKELEIDPYIQYLGWVEESWSAPLYRHAKAFVLASREETFGLCVLEAMACGTPCIVNRIKVMEEVTGGAAVITDFGDPEVASKALARVLSDSREIKDISERALKQAQTFSFEKLATERIEAIKNLLSKNRCSI